LALASVKNSARYTILIVDDEPDIREVLRVSLELQGYICHCAATSHEARRRFEAEVFDLVITDLYLQDSNCSGMELIDHVRRRDDTIPVILIAGYPSIPRAVDAMRRGEVDFVAKPFDRDLLLHKIGNALQERRLRQENRALQAEVNKTAVIEQLNRELDRRIDELTRLYTISEGFDQFMETDQLFDRITEIARDVTGAQRISVMVLDRTRSFLEIRAAVGVPDQVVQSTRQQIGNGLAGQVARTGKHARVTDRMIDLCVRASDGRDADYRTNSWMSLPLYIGEEIFGVLNVTDKMDGSDFSDEDEHVLLSLTEKAGTKLENQALYEGIYSNLVDTLNSLVTTIEAKDPYTRHHSQRVTDYSISLAKLLSLDDDQIEMLNFAGMLHDIGKIGVRDDILIKVEPLSEEEFETIKLHPTIGERIVEPLGLVPEEKAIIRHHHERYDGKGYPDGLKGEAIPLLARVVAVTDAFDAMTTTRSYRQALPVPTALGEMRRYAGTQFDPQIANVWVEAVEQNHIPVSFANTVPEARPA